MLVESDQHLVNLQRGCSVSHLKPSHVYAYCFRERITQFWREAPFITLCVCDYREECICLLNSYIVNSPLFVKGFESTNFFYYTVACSALGLGF